jgi:hypothetical protein
MATKLKIEKRGDEIKKKSSLKLLSQSQPNFVEHILGWFPFQNCVRQPRPPFKMATVTKNRNFFKWPKLLYFKPEPPFFLFLAWWPSWLEVGITGHNFGRGPPKNHFSKVWLILAQ